MWKLLVVRRITDNEEGLDNGLRDSNLGVKSQFPCLSLAFSFPSNNSPYLSLLSRKGASMTSHPSRGRQVS